MKVSRSAIATVLKVAFGFVTISALPAPTRPEPEKTGTLSCQAGEVYTIPLATSAADPFLKVIVRLDDGISRLFLVDTGAPGCIVDRDFAKALKLPIKIREGGNRIEYVVSKANIGGASLTYDELPLILYDMRLIRETNPNIVGIVGLNFLRNYSVRLDFSKKEMQLMTGGNITGTPYALKDARVIPLSLDEDYSYVNATLDGNPTRFILDTGADYLLLRSPDLLKTLKPQRQVDGKIYTVANGSGQGLQNSLHRILRLKSLKIGEIEWLNPIAHQGTPPSKETNNALGIQFLRPYRVILDFPAEKMYLAPDPDYHEDKEAWVQTGVDVRYNAVMKKMWLESVLSPSPAKEAGLRVDDEILEYNGVPITNLNPGQLDEIASKHLLFDKEVRIKVRHVGEDKPFIVVLIARQIL